MSQSTSPEQNPFRQMYEDWSMKTPIITKNSMIVIFFIYVLSFFFSLDMALGNTPYFSIFHFEIYRIVFSPLVGNSLLTILLICLFYPTMGSRMETSLGSASFLLMLCTLSMTTNVIFDFICLGLYILGVPAAVFWSCSGFWVILFSLIVIECMQMPDIPRRIFCFPVEVPSKYFPLVLYILFCFLSGPQLDFAVAMGVGYLYSKGYLNFTSPSVHTIQNMEHNGIFSSLSRNSGWIHSSAALGMEAMFAGGGGGSDVEAGRGMGFFSRQGNGETTNVTTERQANPFPGSGRSLSSGNSSGWGSGFSTLAAKVSSGDAGRSSIEDREAVASRRLAALGIKTDSSSSKGNGVNNSSQFIAGASAPPVSEYYGTSSQRNETLDLNLRTLLDMGFPRDDAHAALVASGNSLDDAITRLSSEM